MKTTIDAMKQDKSAMGGIMIPKLGVLEDIEALRVERDALAKEVERLAESCNYKHSRISTLSNEIDELKAAAKLALFAGEKFIKKCDRGQAKSIETYSELTVAIEALRKAGVE